MMIFLKAMLSKHKSSIIIIILMLGFWGYQWLNHKAQINQLNGIIEQAKVNMLEEMEKDTLAQIEYANKVVELEGLYLIQKKESIKWKNQYFEIKNAIQDTVETGGIKVSFEKHNPCMGVKGYTVTATELEPAYSIVNIYSYPISIERKYMNVRGKIVEIIRPENNCVEFKRITFDVPPSLFEQKISYGFSYKPLVIGGILGAGITFLILR